MTKRVALYARVSTGAGQQTVENQFRDLRAVADRLGWALAATYVDEGVSGAKGRDRRPASTLCSGPPPGARSIWSPRGRPAGSAAA